MGTTTITATPGQPQIVITREFDAPRDLVFRAFTDPELIVQWMGPKRLTMTIDHMEVRDGGTYRFTHQGDDGTAHGFRGVFHGTPSPESTVRTFEYEGYPGHISLESLTLEERDGRTLSRAVSTFQSVEDRNGMVESGMQEGVDDGFDKLDDLLARLVPAR